MNRVDSLRRLPCAVGNYWNRPLGSKLIILGAAAFLLELLAPWQRICAVTADPGNRICGWRTGYEGSEFGTYAAFFAGAILVWELLPVIAPRLSMKGWPAAIITAVLGVALAITTLVKVIEDNEFQTIWAWLGLAVALTVMLIGLIRVRYRWRIRGDDRPPGHEPAASGDAPRADVH